MFCDFHKGVIKINKYNVYKVILVFKLLIFINVATMYLLYNYVGATSKVSIISYY